jgi:integrase
LDFAKVSGYRDGENPARWRGHLDELLPPQSKVRRVMHHAALPFSDLPAFMIELQKQTGTSALALEFAILTAARTSEVLGARWSEIDLNEKVWSVPAARMKMDRDHRVPLAPRAVDLLTSIKPPLVGADAFVFPGAKPKRPLSNMAFLMLLRRMKRDDITAHGLRATFKTWAAERTTFQNEIIEASLAHVVGSKVEQAYMRGDLFDKRRQLMTEWADYCGA